MEPHSWKSCTQAGLFSCLYLLNPLVLRFWCNYLPSVVLTATSYCSGILRCAVSFRSWMDPSEGDSRESRSIALLLQCSNCIHGIIVARFESNPMKSYLPKRIPKRTALMCTKSIKEGLFYIIIVFSVIMRSFSLMACDLERANSFSMCVNTWAEYRTNVLRSNGSCYYQRLA